MMWRGPLFSGLLHGVAIAATSAAAIVIWPSAPTERTEPPPVNKATATPATKAGAPLQGESRPPLRLIAGSARPSAETTPRAIGDTGFAAVVVYVSGSDAQARSWPASTPIAPGPADVASPSPAGSPPQRTTTPETAASIVDRIPWPVVSAVRTARRLQPRLDREDAPRELADTARAQPAELEAIDRYRAGAEAGRDFARYNLALSHLHGRGVPRNPVAAVEQFRRAAINGHAPAMLRLAELYLADNGLPRDMVEAQAWYRVAGAIGRAAARQAAALVEAQLDLEQRAAARKRAIALQSSLAPSRQADWQEKNEALLAAIKRGDRTESARLLDQGADGNTADPAGRTVLISAAWRGHVAIVDLLIEAGADLDGVDDQGRTALMWASINGYPALVAKLASRSAAVDAADDAGLTPLMRAAWNGHAEAVRLLLQSGANPRRSDRESMTAMDRARLSQNPAIAAVLRKAAGAP